MTSEGQYYETVKMFYDSSVAQALIGKFAFRKSFKNQNECINYFLLWMVPFQKEIIWYAQML